MKTRRSAVLAITRVLEQLPEADRAPVLAATSILVGVEPAESVIKAAVAVEMAKARPQVLEAIEGTVQERVEHVLRERGSALTSELVTATGASRVSIYRALGRLRMEELASSKRAGRGQRWTWIGEQA